MYSTKEIKERLINHKEEIIQKYHKGMLIKEIAEEEDVSRGIISRYIMEWGVWERRKRKNAFPGGYKNKKEKKLIPFEKRISPELLKQQKANSISNQGKIKYYIR